MRNTFKNHVYVMLDRSTSMNGIIDTAKDVFNAQIDALREASLRHEQETRISFYTFSTEVECVISDVDVARPVKLEEIKADGWTALRDAFALAVADSREIPQKYGDHSFVFYIITDGEENRSKTTQSKFMDLIQSLPENCTVAAFVPDTNGKNLMTRLGIPAGNVEIWKTTTEGVKEVGTKFGKTMDNFFTARKTGVKASQTMFSDLTKVNSKNVGKVLDVVKNYDIIINEGVKAVQIRDLVEAKLSGKYKTGNAYYELVKNEHVQSRKQIAIQNKKTGKVYTGDNARQLLNLPDHEVKVVPGDFGEWIVFVQSTSVNRNVIPKQRILVLK